MSAHRTILESILERMVTHTVGLGDILEDQELDDEVSLDFVLVEEAEQLQQALTNFLEEIGECGD